MKKFLKVILAAIILSILLSLVVAIVDYTPEAEREAGNYYSSIGMHFMSTLFYFTPVLLVVSTAVFIVFVVMGKVTRVSRLPKVGLSILIAGSLLWVAAFLYGKSNETDDLYLIPEGYVGDVLVFYNIKGAPKVNKENGYEMHAINEKGYFVTSTPDMDYGTVTDQYVYVDEKGKRTPISDKCVSLFGTGGYSSENDEIDMKYTGFRLTKDECGDAFVTESHSWSDDSINEIFREVLKTYYGVEEFFGL